MTLIENHISDFDYTADGIARLGSTRPDLLPVMAQLGLRGYRFRCGHETVVGNRWWSAYDPTGYAIPGVGGLDLINVVSRVLMRARRAGDIE